MSRKRNPYIPLFTHDIMSSSKCRRLSMRATGLYLWLFCLMNEKPQQGRWALSTNEDHPTWKNSLTYRALQNTSKYARLPMFATLMARKFLPWKSGEVLKALQELVRFKLIVVEDDAIIQPRMYRDNGFKLREDTMREYLADNPNDTADDPETDLAETYREVLEKGGKKGGNNGADKGTKKDPEKVHGIHARAQLNIESESENNIKNSISKGGAGEKESKQKIAADGVKNTKMGKYTSKGKKTQEPPSKQKTEGIKRQGADAPMRNKIPPTIEDVQAYITEQAEKGKPFQYITAEVFFDACAQSGWTLKNGKPIKDWQARLRTFESYRREHGDAPVNQRKASAPPGKGQAVPTQDNKEYEEW